MKTLNLILLAFGLMLTVNLQAQTAEEIVANYIETIGGAEKLGAITSTRSTGKIALGQMQLPVTMIQTNGKVMAKAEFQGMTFYQGVYDGETMWSTNQMTMAPEKATSEDTANYALEMNDFPDPLYNYKEKGYVIELIGSETMEGTDTFKVKVVKEPVTVDGVQKDNVAYYYFEKDNFVPIAIESEVNSGPLKGQTAITKLSDYQEVDGVYFPFAILETVKGSPDGQQITLEKVEINPKVDETIFVFPKQN